MKQEMPERPGWVLGTWLGCLVLVGLLTFTPLELAPRPLENLPRWGLWLLAVPACRRLRAYWPGLRQLWVTLPWLLWGYLALVLTFYVAAWLSDDRTEAGYLLRVRVLECLADDRVSRTTHVLFRRGRQEVVDQLLMPFHTTAPRALRMGRTVQVTHVVPGVQWITRLPELGILDASWQAADLNGVVGERERRQVAHQQARLSRDTALHLRLDRWQQARDAALQKWRLSRRAAATRLP